MDRLDALLLATCLAAANCGASRAPAGPAVGTPPGPGVAARGGEDQRPRFEAVVREGDGQSAFALAVSTEGIAEDHPALAAVALAALVERRLALRGVAATAVGGWDGWRLRALVASPADAARVVLAAREALLQPVSDDDAALPAVARRAEALALRPLPDASLARVARCTGEAYATGETKAPSAAELETWRAAAHGLGRIAFAAAGSAPLVGAVGEALARTPPWPRARAAPATSPPLDTENRVYEASGEVAPGAAQIIVTAHVDTAARAIAVAPALGDPRGPLALRLAALDAPARVRSVIATAHVDGGCVALTLELAARDLASSAPERIATAAALARQEMSVEIADGAARPDAADDTSRRAADPRDAAERAAWWALAANRAAMAAEPSLALTIGVAAARGAAEAPSADVLRTAIDRATLAWRSPVVEERLRVERGQGEAWLLLGSPCGTLPEASTDAGLGATVAVAAASQAEGEAADARVEPFVDPEGVGVVIHGPAAPGETPRAHVRRLADVAARALAAIPLDATRIDGARTALLTRASDADARLFAVLGGAVAPEHPSWLLPAGTMFGLMSATNDAAAARAAAVRAGPLRVAVLANADSTQAGAAVAAVDRWIARRPADARSCPPLPTLAPARAGTYAVDLPAGARSEALIAGPLPPNDEAAHRAAIGVAALLGGPGGLLARALGGDAEAGAPLAREWSARVVGGPQAAALVVRIVASEASLDAAVAQTRALLDRVRQGALRDEDRARAAAMLADAEAASALDPRTRLVALWRGTPPYTLPSLDELRAFAAASLRDEGFVIVAARPARVPGAKR